MHNIVHIYTYLVQLVIYLHCIFSNVYQLVTQMQMLRFLIDQGSF